MLFINGQWLTGEGETLASKNPVTQQIIWQGATASPAQVASAGQAARQAFSAWKKTAVSDRIALCRKFAELVKAHRQEFGHLIGSETGKPLWEALTEADTMVAKVDISVQSYHERTGQRQADIPAGHTRLTHKPLGVVAVFGPYNFPGHLPNGHIVPALIAGNTVLFKPSELAPGVAELTIKLWQEAGLPDGVINLLQGGKDTGIALADSSDINGLFFTGSAATGKQIHRQFAGQPGKMLALEMGGNNPLIIDRDFDLDGALHHTITSAFLSAGQRCTCARRLFVPKCAEGDQFLSRLVKIAASLTVGHFDQDPQPFMGAVVSLHAADQLEKSWNKLVLQGGRPLLNLTRLKPGTALVSPGIIDLSQAENVPDEEYFGPLLSVYRYSDLDEAIAEANNTRYGLSAGIITNSEQNYRYFSEEINAGIVNWNRPITGASSAAPFGGIGDSGNLRPSAYYAADYCAYPVAGLEGDQATVPDKLPPGLII